MVDIAYVENPERERIPPVWNGPVPARKKPGVYHDAEKGKAVARTTYVPDLIPVVRTFRMDPIGQLFARGQLDTAQHAAARRWQGYLEDAQTPLRSSGHLQEPVDGGGRLPQGITDRQLEAHKKLLHYAQLLGPRQFYLLKLVCEDGYSLWGATAAMFPDDLGPPRRRFTGQWLREILSELAKDMGLSG